MTKLTLPPSSADRWHTCHASAALEKVYGVRTQSKYMKEGILAHEVAALHLKGSYQGFTSPDVTSEMLQCASYYLDFVNEIRSSGNVVQELIEQRLDTGRSFGTSQPSKGDVDYGALVSDGEGGFTLWVVDYKYGKGVKVSAYRNMQMISYGRALIDKWMIKGQVGITVKLCIFQPRISEYASVWTLPMVEFCQISSELWASASATGAGVKTISILPATPSKSGCNFCAAKLNCKRLRMELNDIFAAYGLEGFNGDPQLITDAVESISTDELGTLYDRLEVLALLKKAVVERITETISKGDKVPGWGIGAPSQGNRRYKDPGSILSYLCNGMASGDLPFGLTEEIPLSPVQLLKAVKRREYPDAVAYIESQIIRDFIDGKVQRIYDNDPTEEDLPDTGLLPIKPLGV